MTTAFLILGGLILVGLIWLATLNGKYHVKRSILIDEAPPKVFNLVYDFNHWNQWSPWLCMEPKATVTLEGAPQGEGAIYKWNGDLVGSGEIEHILINDEQEIIQEIRFLKPFKSTSSVYWKFDETSNGYRVTWGMKGKMPFLFRFMTKKMEAFIEMDYERGLKMLKELAETDHVSSQVEIVGVVDAPQHSYLGETVSCSMDEVGTTMQETFGKLERLAKSHDFHFSQAISVYRKFDYEKSSCQYTAGLITEKGDFSINGMEKHLTQPTKALKVIFRGDYKNIPNGWSAGFAWLRKNKIRQNKAIPPFELYLTNPKEEPNKDNWVTEIFFPIK